MIMKIALIGDSLTEGRPGVSFAKILQEKFPECTFSNLGKPGESVKSLDKRLTKNELDQNYDLSFLWIGVNDVYSKLLSVQAQPVAKDHDEFKEYYEKNLAAALTSSKKVVAVSPALVGEDLNNASNQEIKQLSSLIESLSAKHSNVHFLNLHSIITERLSTVRSSDFISTKVMRVMLDVLFYKNPARIDKLSEERGLHFTMDGIHLNSKGAQVVADVFAAKIDEIVFNKKENIL
jgi:lysophospholipase L1-like esterase